MVSTTPRMRSMAVPTCNRRELLLPPQPLFFAAPWHVIFQIISTQISSAILDSARNPQVG
jgi:hypothetical protein